MYICKICENVFVDKCICSSSFVLSFDDVLKAKDLDSYEVCIAEKDDENILFIATNKFVEKESRSSLVAFYNFDDIDNDTFVEIMRHLEADYLENKENLKGQLEKINFKIEKRISKYVTPHMRMFLNKIAKDLKIPLAKLITSYLILYGKQNSDIGT